VSAPAYLQAKISAMMGRLMEPVHLARRALRWPAAAVLTAGCAVYSGGIPRDASLDPSRAYLYGRVFIKAEEQYGTFAGKQSMGLVISCQDGNTNTFGSLDKRDVQVLEVRPSRCWLDEAILADQDGSMGTSQITIYGSPCQAIQAGATKTVSITHVCVVN
jgi:hypothetical protein